LTTLCLFAGWQPGEDPIYLIQAQRLGQALARRGLHLVFGGTTGGLMGRVAETLVEQGGQVTGVVPEGLWEVLHFTRGRLQRVVSLEERIARMAHLADGFLVLPGGIGTLHEFFAILTQAQVLGCDKPIGLLNIADFFTPLLTWLDALVEAGFVLPGARRCLWCATDPERLLDMLLERCAPALD
jgi:uncharacterized protein (TIGR00730 family)